MDSTIFLQRFADLKKHLAENEEQAAQRIGYTRSYIQKLKRGEITEPNPKAINGLIAAERSAGILRQDLNGMSQKIVSSITNEDAPPYGSPEARADVAEKKLEEIKAALRELLAKI